MFPSEYSTSRILNLIYEVFYNKHLRWLWVLRQEVLMQNVYYVPKHGLHDILLKNICLNYILHDEVCFHSMNCRFNSGAMCDTHVSFPVEVIACSLHCVKKANALSCHLIFWYSSVVSQIQFHKGNYIKFVKNSG